MKTYWNIDKQLKTIPEWQPNCWIQVTCPTDDDQRELEEKYRIPDYFMSDISDTDERARYEYDDGWMLIILRIPYVKEIRSRTPYTTVPLGIKHNLDHEVNNESLIGLSRLQDSLTYFITSIRGNENLLQKLKFKLQVDELDADLIEDVGIEMTQARETTNIYSDILESTMDTYSSIINNNMNTTMRTLTSLNIVLMAPTLISSIYGMNVINGLETSHYGFVICLAISVLVTGVSWWILRHKRLI